MLRLCVVDCCVVGYSLLPSLHNCLLVVVCCFVCLLFDRVRCFVVCG